MDKSNVVTMTQTQTTTPTKSHKVFVQVKDEWVTNGLRFGDANEALRYAEDVSARWTQVQAYDVQPSDEEPNAQMLRFGKYVKADDEDEAS